MGSTRLNGQYLRSYEQLSIKFDSNCDCEVKPERINGIYLRIFEYLHKNQKKLIQNWNSSHRKFKKSETPKMVSKRLNGHYLRSYDQLQKIELTIVFLTPKLSNKSGPKNSG